MLQLWTYLMALGRAYVSQYAIQELPTHSLIILIINRSADLASCTDMLNPRREANRITQRRKCRPLIERL